MTKRRTIALTSGHQNVNFDKGRERMWIVRKVTNSVTFSPGTWLHANEVAALCEDETWEVSITEGNKQ